MDEQYPRDTREIFKKIGTMVWIKIEPDDYELPYYFPRVPNVGEQVWIRDQELLPNGLKGKEPTCVVSEVTYHIHGGKRSDQSTATEEGVGHVGAISITVRPPHLAPPIPQNLKALAEIRKHQIVAAKLNPSTATLYDNAFVYAVVHSVHPVYHEHDRAQRDSAAHFAAAYDIDRGKVEAVHDILDKKRLGDETITFRELMNMLFKENPQWTGIEGDLHLICRYLFLGGRFANEFWEQVMAQPHGTAEVGILEPWSNDDLV